MAELYILDRENFELVDLPIAVHELMVEQCALLNRGWDEQLRRDIGEDLDIDPRFVVLAPLVSPDCQYVAPKDESESDHFFVTLLKPDYYGSPVTLIRWPSVDDWQAVADREGVDVLVATLKHKVIGYYKPTAKKPTVTYETPYNEAELSAMVDTLQTSEAVTAVIEGVRSGKYVIADESSKLTNLCSHDTCSANCDDQSCQPRHTAIPLSDAAASRMRAMTNDVYITSGPIDQNGYAPIEPNGQPVAEPTATPIYVYQQYNKWCFERDLKDSGVWDLSTILDAANFFNTRVYHCELAATVKPSDKESTKFPNGFLLAVFNHRANEWIVTNDLYDARLNDAPESLRGIALHFDSHVYLLKVIAHADPELIRHGYN